MDRSNVSGERLAAVPHDHVREVGERIGQIPAACTYAPKSTGPVFRALRGCPRGPERDREDREQRGRDAEETQLERARSEEGPQTESQPVADEAVRGRDGFGIQPEIGRASCRERV